MAYWNQYLDGAKAPTPYSRSACQDLILKVVPEGQSFLTFAPGVIIQFLPILVLDCTLAFLPTTVMPLNKCFGKTLLDTTFPKPNTADAPIRTALSMMHFSITAFDLTIES